MMDDLISRQKLLNDVEELRQSPWVNDDNYFAIRKDAVSCVVELCVKKAPSVDAVEVVRCKDCKYFDGECCDRYADETLGYSHSTQPNFFCACGERKINDSQMQSNIIRQDRLSND